jgi:hypothetical protein
MCVKIRFGISFLAIALAALPAFAQGDSCPKCGTERWDIKTLSDPAAKQVDLTPKTATVKELYDMTAPTEGATRNTSEKKTYTVHAKLVGYKIEFDKKNNTGDHDFHIVIQDMNGPETMVVEIPDPQCGGVCSSGERAAILQARKSFLNGVAQPPEASFRTLATPVDVDITGVLFFDFAHGQTGLAKNCVELHPVLSIKFASKPTAAENKANEPKPEAKSFYKCLPEERTEHAAMRKP